MTNQQFASQRRGHIGASDAGSLFSVGYGCQRALWYDKTGTDPDAGWTEPITFALGHALEPVFLRAGLLDIGVSRDEADEVVEVGANHGFEIRDQSGLLLCHPDAILRDGRIVEVKSMGAAAWWKARRDGLPPDYIMQLQLELHLASAPAGVFIIGNRDSGSIAIFVVERDAALGEKIQAQANWFWDAYIAGPPYSKTEPDRLDTGDSRCSGCRFRRQCWGGVDFETTAAPDSIEYDNSESLRFLIESHDDAQAQVRDAEAELQQIKDAIKGEMGERTAVDCGGRKVYFREQKVERIDAKALGAYYIAHRQPSDPPLEEFKTITVQRPLRIY